jgi:hypothetical protein
LNTLTVNHHALKRNSSPTRPEDILSRVRISQVYQALTGVQPRGRGDVWRAPAVWRKGDGFNVSLDDSRGVWHDFTTDDGGGILDLVVRVRGGTRADALRWCGDLAGVPLEDRTYSAEDRARWAQAQKELESELPTAEYWRRAAVSMTEDILDSLKAALFDPTLPRPDVGEIFRVESLLASLRRKDGAELIAEYHWWLERHPGMTAALVRAAKQRERAERRALSAFLRLAEDPRQQQGAA